MTGRGESLYPVGGKTKQLHEKNTAEARVWTLKFPSSDLFACGKTFEGIAVSTGVLLQSASCQDVGQSGPRKQSLETVKTLGCVVRSSFFFSESLFKRLRLLSPPFSSEVLELQSGNWQIRACEEPSQQETHERHASTGSSAARRLA